MYHKAQLERTVEEKQTLGDAQPSRCLGVTYELQQYTNAEKIILED